MNVLLVTRDLEQRRALTEMFVSYDGDLVLELADSALFALTQPWRDSPDVIVSAGEVGMSGAEFLEIVRADALLKDAAFVLLDESVLEQLTPGAREIVLEKCAPPAVVLGAALTLLARRLDENVAETIYFQGTTAFVSPFDLLTLLAGESKTGLLTFELAERAALHFVAGRLVHAEYGRFRGEEALVETFRAVYAAGNVPFGYRPAAAVRTPATSHGPSETFGEPLQALLLRVALELDSDLNEKI